MSALVIHLLSVAVLAVLVEAACRLGRFRPAVCHALWLVVLVKLLVPPVVSWPVDAELLGRLSWERMAATPSPGSVPGESLAVVERAAGEAVGSLRPGEEFTVRIPHDEWGGLSWAVVLGGIWLGGGLIGGVKVAREVVRARRRLVNSESLPGWMEARLDEAARELGVAAPRAVVVREPGAVHVQVGGRPVLVISAEALAHVAPEQWDAILTHELAHLKRRDHWVAWLMLAAGVVWWWNPILWWVRNRVHLFSEMACDAWVVNVHPGARKQYAETMVRIMALLSRQEAPAPAMGLAAWSASSQERRLWMIMKAKGGCRVHWLGAVGVMALAVLAVPGCRTTDEDVEEVAQTKAAGWTLSLAPAKSLESKLAEPANVEFEDIHIKDIFEFMRDAFELNVVVDQRVIKPEQVAGMAPVPDSPKGGKPYASDGMVPFIKLLDTPLGEFLKALTRPLQLKSQSRGHMVWISTAEQFAIDEAVPMPSADFSAGAILDKLNSPVHFEFEQIHLKDVLEFIQDSFEVNFVLDKRAIADEGADFNAPRADSPGYTTDGMIRRIGLGNVPLGEALYAITRSLNLTYGVKENYIFISSPELIDSVNAAPPAE